jgi:biopolymer transport protein ExbB/TolQ
MTILSKIADAKTRVFGKVIHLPSRQAGQQYLVMLVVALLLTRCWMEVIDRLLFDASEWSSPFQNTFRSELKSQASMLTSNISEDKMSVEVDDTAFVAVPYSPSLSRDSRISIVRIQPKSRAKDDARLKDEVKRGSTGVVTLVESDFSVLTGIRKFELGERMNVLPLTQRIRETRWVQLAIESSQSSVRHIIMLTGTVQWFTYLSFFIGIVFVSVEVLTLRKDERLLFDRSLIPIFLQEEQTSRLQNLANRLRGIRVNTVMADEISPSVVVDLADTGFKFLLNRSGEPNVAELHTVLDAAGNTALEKINSRYQIIRYFANAIPSLGFIGTVLGISEALGHIGAMTSGASAPERMLANYGLSSNLYVAFDTTLVALVLGIILGFLVDTLETRSIGIVLKAKKQILENASNVRVIKKDVG